MKNFWSAIVVEGCENVENFIGVGEMNFDLHFTLMKNCYCGIFCFFPLVLFLEFYKHKDLLEAFKVINEK